MRGWTPLRGVALGLMLTMVGASGLLHFSGRISWVCGVVYGLGWGILMCSPRRRQALKDSPDER